MLTYFPIFWTYSCHALLANSICSLTHTHTHTMTTAARCIWLCLTGPSYTHLRLMTTFVHVRCLSWMIQYSSDVLPPQLCCSPVHTRAYAPRRRGPTTNSQTVENQYLQHLHIIINRSDQTFNFSAKILQTWRR